MSDSSRQRLGSFSKSRYRNLVQYKNLSDDEYDRVWDQLTQGIKKDQELDTRIERKIEEFGKDYDLDDLKINDLLTLRALAQTYITLEDYELYAYNLRKDGISLDRMIEMEKLNNIMSSLRKDISNMQNDLNITRKVRKGDKETSVINYLEELKQKAREFYQDRMMYIFCPECKNLLFTGWFHYPKQKGNKVQLICDRDLGNGQKCGHKFQISVADLQNDKDRGVNITDVPESFR